MSDANWKENKEFIDTKIAEMNEALDVHHNHYIIKRLEHYKALASKLMEENVKLTEDSVKQSQQISDLMKDKYKAGVVWVLNLPLGSIGNGHMCEQGILFKQIVEQEAINKGILKAEDK